MGAMRHWMIRIAMVTALAPLARGDDWPMWGHDPSRNMVSAEKGLPVSFDPGKSEEGKGVDMSTTKGIKWAVKIGSHAYGNTTVANGRIYIGTNNEPAREAKYPGDMGVVLCLDEATGKTIWHQMVPKLPGGNNVDYEHVGICSSPTIEGDRVYLVTNRGEVLCLDAKGMANGNDGPFKDEAQYVAGPGKPPIEQSANDGDIIWKYDMRDELGVFAHNMTAGGCLIVGDRVYVTTSNGVDWSDKHMPAPDAPALICLDKNTGKLLGQERSGISSRTFHGNWSTPALATVNGRQMIIYGGDDGYCYAFDPVPQDGTLKEIWRCDCNSSERRANRYRTTKGPSGIVSTPVCVGDRVYVATGQDPEQNDGDGGLVCIDASKTGDITQSGKVWEYKKIGHVLGTPSVADGLVVVGDFAGILYCFDATNGQLYWSHDTESRIWGSTLVADGKIYAGNEGGALLVLAESKEKKVINTVTFEGAIYSSPVVANGVMYIATETYLYAIGGKK